jgi:D-xylose 1-dehydrogenase (NADP+, D-xylono-1,5-lactone-forming)
MNTLRWGILGTGNIARQFAAGLKGSQRGELISVASRARETGHAFAMEYRARTLWLGYENLIKDPDVDAVYISLPNSMHHEWTIAALKAGKHVLCEKPLATNAAQAEEMFDVAQRCGKVLIEAFMYRSHPLTLAVIDAVKHGAIGELKMIRTSFCFRTRSVDGNIRFDSGLTGGSLMDVGCYCINFSRLFAGGEPEQIHAIGKLHSSGVDEYAGATMRFANGIIASMVCGMTVQADNTAYLCGSDGYIEIPIPWKPPSGEAIYVISGSVPPRMEKPETSGKPPAPGSAPREVRRVASPGELYGFEADDFASAALDGTPPRLGRADSVGNMRVLDEMRRQIGVKC